MCCMQNQLHNTKRSTYDGGTYRSNNGNKTMIGKSSSGSSSSENLLWQKIYIYIAEWNKRVSLWALF